ncbi:MAG TPA: hypothetical protein VFE82_06690 [Ramlibacter sp.]|jgi:hypothetical protein|uniref:hypothetical protein n=1 Tax=Ramlibacter sp. TaxID=1917967 RepID=UPI002D692F44|nr:hypothetical protein [Ramlibacter sp.]HZY18153.1 hypothetical protein [Ramlibacter sp.]
MLQSLSFPSMAPSEQGWTHLENGRVFGEPFSYIDMLQTGKRFRLGQPTIRFDV